MFKFQREHFNKGWNSDVVDSVRDPQTSISDLPAGICGASARTQQIDQSSISIFGSELRDEIQSIPR